MKQLLVLIFSILIFSSCVENTEEIINNNETTTIETIDYDAKLKELGIDLREPSKPVANYVNVVQTGNLLFLAGKGPKKADGEYIKGKVGRDLTEEEGYKAARLTGELQLGVLKDHLGDLNRVKRIVKVMGMVNCTDDFGNQPRSC